MKQKIKNLLIISLVLSVLVLNGCTKEPSLAISSASAKNNTATYSITKYFGDDSDIEQYVKDIKEEDICQSIVFNQETQTVDVIVTPEQKQLWLDKSKKIIEDTVTAVAEDDHYTISCEEEYAKMIVTSSIDWNAGKLASDMVVILYNMELEQIFSGTPDWSVDFLLKDSSTGETVYEAVCPKEAISISDATWNNENSDS